MSHYEVHEDWATESFDLPVLAPQTGPFVRRELLRIWYEQRGKHGKVLLVDSGTALLPFYGEGDVVQFLGEADLTDYHTPLGDAEAVAALATAYFSDLAPGTRFVLDSLPIEAVGPLEGALVSAGIGHSRVQHEVAAVLQLPPTFDEWLGGIGKKERHEVRRKRRRFEAELGTPRLERVSGDAAVDRFVHMHRTSSGDKGSFMSAGLATFFLELHRRAGAVVDALTTPAGDTAAAAFAFEDAEAYYLYNSAYDAGMRSLSPGVVLLSALVERAIVAGYSRLDFLKGDEPYKFRHGAQPRPLYSLTGQVS